MENSKALEMLNLVEFRHKAKNIKNTTYGKTFNTYKYMINDNFSICYIRTYDINSYGYIEFREVNSLASSIEISEVDVIHSLSKISGKSIDVHIQNASQEKYSISNVRKKNSIIIDSINKVKSWKIQLTLMAYCLN